MHLLNVTPLHKLLVTALKEAKLDLSKGFADHLEAIFLQANNCYGNPEWLRKQYADYLEAEAKRIRSELKDPATAEKR
jgi:hypothetical protein